jgi:hypothetical protein
MFNGFLLIIRARDDSANFGNFPDHHSDEEYKSGPENRADPPAPWSASSRDLPPVSEENESDVTSPKKYVFSKYCS